MGVAYHRLGEYRNATYAYKKAIKIKSDYHHPYTHTLVLLTKRLLPLCYLRAIID
jgi:Flp pilus assembly protein TadD